MMALMETYSNLRRNWYDAKDLSLVNLSFHKLKDSSLFNLETDIAALTAFSALSLHFNENFRQNFSQCLVLVLARDIIRVKWGRGPD